MRVCKNKFFQSTLAQFLALSLGALMATHSSAKLSPLPGRAAQTNVPVAVGMGFELNASESDVLQVVEEVAADPIIRGTYVYEKQKILSGALPARSSSYFGAWTGPGHVFYKVLTGAIAPRHFKDSADQGAITVRYVVESESGSRVHLWIAAVFVEDGSRKAALSDGTVESSEFKQIQDRLQQTQATSQETATLIAKRQQEAAARATATRERLAEEARLESAESSLKNLETLRSDLRHKVIVEVLTSGTELKSAPFHSANSLQTLPAGEELVVLIVTPAWLGVETPD